MHYALLIYADREAEAAWASASEERRREVYARYEAFGRLLEARGALVGGDELAGSASATTVRGEGDRAVITDGPFAEVAEHLAGFYIVDARDLDEALEFARALPAATVEVRPTAQAQVAG